MLRATTVRSGAEPDASQDVEENITSEILVEQFKATLTEKMAILQMRMEGDTLEEIAEKLGYKPQRRFEAY